MRLLCFLDDNDSGRLRGERGRYETIHDGTPLAHLPDYVGGCIYVDDHVSFYYPRVIDGLVILYGSTCTDEVGLSMTLAHELQHTIQQSSHRQVWAVNGLVNQLNTGASSLSVASTIIRAPESLGVIVDGLYVKVLLRTSDAATVTARVRFLHRLSP